MQNSSFLFNYDSEDSSAHYESSYQSSSQNQSKGEQVTCNSQLASIKGETQADGPDGSSKHAPPNNERDGSAHADNRVVQPFQDDVTEDDATEDDATEDDVTEDSITRERDEAFSELMGSSGTVLSAQEKSISERSSQESSKRIDARTVWQNTLAELVLQMPAATYDTWMRDTYVIAYEDGEFIIGLPNAYARDWIMNRLQNKIKRILGKLVGRSVQVTFRIAPVAIVNGHNAKPAPLYDSLESDSRQPDLQQNSHTGSKSVDSLSHPSGVNNSGVNNSGVPTQTTDYLGSRSGSADNHMADNNVTDSNRESSQIEPSVNQQQKDESAVNNTIAQPQNGYQNSDGYYGAASANPPTRGGIDGTLRSGYTFDTFIVGSHNQLAHAAAASIADGPGQSFNPLFIYGGVGLGKTHLLHAVGNLAAMRGSRVLYCTSEQFTNELITSIRGRGTEEFREKYRQVDVLLIDDIQFIAGKESTQEEFFHTFNHLHTAGRQVVLSSDRPPKALATLEERLRSRFEGGLLTDISQPDFETRVAILQSKANKSGIRINSGVLMLIAEKVDSNIRELEGALNRMVVQAKLFSNTLDLQLAESILKNLAPQRLPRSPSIVIRIVAEHFHLTADDMSGRSRTKDIASARQIAMYLLREENGMSLPSIGDQLGGRDHSTIRHGVEKIIKDLDRDEQLRREIMLLRDKIYSAPEAI